MNSIIFKSERYFTFFDILVSHGQLLLRSQKSSKFPYNIDIIFFDTSYIQLFGRLNGVCIRKVENADIIEYRPVKEYLSYENNWLFEIESGSERYYLAASFVRVFENQLEFHETSLNFFNIGREKEIATSFVV